MFVIILAFMISSITLGFAVRILERPYYQAEEEGASSVDKGLSNYQDYSFLFNGWWLIVVTMTTVGFGDFFAVTYFGRTVSVIACFIGTFLVSLTVVTLSSGSKYKMNQQRAFNSIISIAHFQKKKLAAARYILYHLRLLRC